MQTMRAPRVEELYSDGPHLATYAFEIGNPDLKKNLKKFMESKILLDIIHLSSMHH